MKRTQSVLIAGSFLLIITLASCDSVYYKRGNGEMIVNTKYVEKYVDNFREVSLSGIYEVFLDQGKEPMVVIKVDENLIDYIEIDSYKGILSITSKEKIKSSDGIKIFITYEDIDKITTGGATAVFTESPITTRHLKLIMSGVGMMEMELDVEDLEVRLSGAGYIKLKGQATEQVVSMTGAGSFEAYDLESDYCDITISGVGGAQVNVTGTLKATVSGIGGIQYKGDPEHINRNVSGLGKITASRTLDL